MLWPQCGKDIRERTRVDVNKLITADVHMRYVDGWTMIKVSLKKEWQVANYMSHRITQKSFSRLLYLV